VAAARAQLSRLEVMNTQWLYGFEAIVLASNEERVHWTRMNDAKSKQYKISDEI
jgi:hypothetical protein